MKTRTLLASISKSLLLSLMILHQASSFAMAAEGGAREPMPPIHPEEVDIPLRPSVPTGFVRKEPHNYFRCPRYYVHKGRELGCDSATRKDGEGLRSLLEENPESLDALNLYQENRMKLGRFAYTSTAGILLMLLAPTIAQQFEGNTKDVVKTLSYTTGVGLIGGSAFLGFSFIRSNESNLQRAVDLYNARFPEDRIELRFSTSFLSF